MGALLSEQVKKVTTCDGSKSFGACHTNKES